MHKSLFCSASLSVDHVKNKTQIVLHNLCYTIYVTQFVLHNLYFHELEYVLFIAIKDYLKLTHVDRI